MNRSLSVADFGVLIALISIITLLMVPSGAISPTIITAAGVYFTRDDKLGISALYRKMIKLLSFFGILLFIVFLVLSSSISHFFRIEESYLVAFSILCVVLFYLSSLNVSFMQARLSFKFLSFVNVVSAFLKAGLAFFLVSLGFGVGGALIGVMLSIALTVFIGVYYFRDFIFYKSKETKKINSKELLSYGVPSAIIMLCLSSLVSSDILLVKHLFDPHNAGLYAGLALVGKVIFFLSAPIGTVMFPMLVEKFEKKIEHKKTFHLSILMVIILSMPVVGFYYFFPEFSVSFFINKIEYLVISPYLFKFSIFIMLYVFISLISYYFLAVKMLKFSYLILSGSIMQVVLIYFFHNGFHQVINSSIISCTFIILSSAFIYKIDQ